jgi:hypothetical protein
MRREIQTGICAKMRSHPNCFWVVRQVRSDGTALLELDSRRQQRYMDVPIAQCEILPHYRAKHISQQPEEVMMRHESPDGSPMPFRMLTR